MKKRMTVLSSCFDDETIELIRDLTKKEGYRSMGEFVRDSVKMHIELINRGRHEVKNRLGDGIPT